MADAADQEQCGNGRHADGRETVLALDGARYCVAKARHLAVRFLTRAQTDHGQTVPAQTIDLTQLVVSELVTNACKYASGPIRLRLRLSDTAVEVEVRDTHSVLPAGYAADPRRIGQHGLEIVKAVAHLTMQPEPTGKRITASITMGPDPHCNAPA
ncbi:ATP-binding protein [Streptomyces sp. NPDC058818]|uniref:ATP-binding protein n=1 Tax=Streptomyces sp. NPDC058818 TaxID=3346640 RepID=UPI003681ACED